MAFSAAFLPSRLCMARVGPRGAAGEDVSSRYVTCLLWMYVPSRSLWGHGVGWGRPSSEVRPGSGSLLMARGPVASPPAPPTLASSRQVFQASIPTAGFSRLFLFWAQHGQIFGDKPTQQPVGNLGAERASRNERPAGRREECQGGSLITGLSVLISHGAWAQTCLRPFTRHWGPDPRGPPSPGHHREIQPKWGREEHMGGGGSWRLVGETRGNRSSREPMKAVRTARGLPCPPRMRGL